MPIDKRAVAIMSSRPSWARRRSKGESEAPLPYHGGAPLRAPVRRIIQNTPVGAEVEMSVPIMKAKLVADGMDAAMANRLASQVHSSERSLFEFLVTAMNERYLCAIALWHNRPLFPLP